MIYKTGNNKNINFFVLYLLFVSVKKSKITCVCFFYGSLLQG